MNFHQKENRKEKRNPSSRYSRMETPWLDEEEAGRTGAAGSNTEPNGYGVRDSYSRQASYGRPEGYYREPGQQDGWRAEQGQYGGYKGRTLSPGGYGSRDPYMEGSYTEGPYTEGPYTEEPYTKGPYTEEPYFEDDAYFDDGEIPGDQYRYGNGSASTDPYMEADAYRGLEKEEKGLPPARARKKSKTGFAVKLILLLVAAGVLVMVWRFSRIRHASLSDVLTNTGVVTPSGYREFVIYGVDSREGNLTKEAHSDTIIICSMNESTKEIRMVSVYRDTYLDNTNGEYRKATECYYFGGPDRSVNMLNKNLDLDLHDYITVDFNAVVKAVDLIGGVDVDVTEEELPYINGYQTENAEVTGAQITPVESAGYQHLNGIQALAYCRIRYTAGSDYRRTERQRAVLSQIFEQAKSQGPVRMAQIVDAMLPYIATSFSSAEILALVTSISGSTLLDSVGFPFDLQAANIAAGDCVVPVNLAANVSKLHTYLYQLSDYTPTQTVQDISNEIANTTGIY